MYHTVEQWCFQVSDHVAYVRVLLPGHDFCAKESRSGCINDEDGYYLSTSSFNRLYSLEIRSSTDCRSRRISRFLYWTSWMSFSFSKIISFLCVSSFFNRSISFCSWSERTCASRLSRSVCSLERRRARWSSPESLWLTNGIWSCWFYPCISQWHWPHSATSILIERWFPTRRRERSKRWTRECFDTDRLRRNHIEDKWDLHLSECWTCFR